MTALSGAVDSGDKTRYRAVLRSGRPSGLPPRNTARPVSYITSLDTNT